MILIPKQHSKTCTYLLIIVQLLQDYIINGMILILILLISSYIDDDVSRRSSYGVYISQRIYALPEHIRILVTLNSRKTFLTAKLLNQGYQDNKLRKVFSKFNRRIDPKISCQSEETSATRYF